MRRNEIAKLQRKARVRVAGLMSGTSADGVNAAIIDISRDKINILTHDAFPYPDVVRRAIFRLVESKEAGAADVSHLNFVIGEVFADALLRLCRKSGIGLKTIDLIGSHGQTIYHNPRGRRLWKRTVPCTLQIGEPAVIAHRTGITTVADFRPRDVAAGGQGAPLVPFADYILFRDKKKNRAVQNIGGIANVTYLPARCRRENIVAFDTGPGNMIIDGIISLATRDREKFDLDGKIAGKGEVNEELLKNMLQHPFFRIRPPKSTGREMFGKTYRDILYEKVKRKGLSIEDIAATVTAFTVASIGLSYRRFLPAMPDEVILCGGGAKNDTLVKMLRKELDGAKIMTSDKLGVNSDAKEAISFAILACATIKGVANNVPSATGADEALILGKITPA
jgi:anhydro-N-acetylmuramic acid kinase